jgi:hypothetical protein
MIAASRGGVMPPLRPADPAVSRSAFIGELVTIPVTASRLVVPDDSGNPHRATDAYCPEYDRRLAAGRA